MWSGWGRSERALKRIWFGAGLLVFLLILGICCGFLVERTCLSQARKLDRAAVLAADSDWAAARTLTQQAKQDWDQKQLLIAALCDHAPMDQIEGLFAQLEAFSDARSATSYSSTCVFLARQLESLGRSHSLTADNLL